MQVAQTRLSFAPARRLGGKQPAGRRTLRPVLAATDPAAAFGDAANNAKQRLQEWAKQQRLDERFNSAAKAAGQAARQAAEQAQRRARQVRSTAAKVWAGVPAKRTPAWGW